MTGSYYDLQTDVITPDSPAEIKTQRESVQAALGLGITAAQDLCAASLHTTRRAYQQWERGERRMHPAFCELLRIKVALWQK